MPPTAYGRVYRPQKRTLESYLPHIRPQKRSGFQPSFSQPGPIRPRKRPRQGSGMRPIPTPKPGQNGKRRYF